MTDEHDLDNSVSAAPGGDQSSSGQVAKPSNPKNSELDKFIKVFVALLSSISIVMAALPAFLANSSLAPPLNDDFKQFGSLMVSAISFLCIGLAFHYRRWVIEHLRNASDCPSPTALPKLWPLVGLLTTIAAYLLYFWAYLNDQHDAVWPLVPYTLMFVAPVLTICLIVICRLDSDG